MLGQRRNMTTEHLESDFERAEYLQNMLIAQATSGTADNMDYGELRLHFLEKPDTKDLVPRFVRTNRDLSQFWQFIKYKFAHYHERRQFIWHEFTPLLEFLEKGGAVPCAKELSGVLAHFNAENVHAAWAKANERKGSDPEGAVTAARMLLETVFKHLLDELGAEYGSQPDLPELYSLVAKKMKLSPSQHTEKAFKQILGGCSSVIEGLGSLRNKLGDAHGQGKLCVRPSPRHAGLAVNIAGAMAMFLVETWEARKTDLTTV